MAVSGRKNTASDGTTLAIDSAEYGFAERIVTTLETTTTPRTVVDDKVTTDGSDFFSYAGSWEDCGGCGGADAYAGGYRYSFTPTSSVTLTFTGSQASLFGTFEAVSGKAWVTVDGQDADEVDLYSSTTDFGELYATDALSLGRHTVTLTLEDSANVDSQGTVMSIDRAEVDKAPPAAAPAGDTAADPQLMSWIADQNASNATLQSSSTSQVVPLSGETSDCDAPGPAPITDQGPIQWGCVTTDAPSNANTSPNQDSSDPGITLLASGRNFPAWCYNMADGYQGDRRHEACEKRGATITFPELSFPYLLPETIGGGRVEYRRYTWTETNKKGDPYIHTQMQGEVKSLWSRTFPNGVTAGVDCSPSCSRVDDAGRYPLTWNVGAVTTWVATFKTTIARDKITITNVNWWTKIQGVTVYPGLNSVKLRCDNRTPGVRVAGCINPKVLGAVTYDSSRGSLTRPVALHVAEAQRSGLPSLVTRETNQAAIDRHRTAACGRYKEKMAGTVKYNCDEYPFAATKQGATPTAAQRVVLSWCQQGQDMPLNYRRGSAGYATCYVPKSANDSQGGKNAAGLLQDRVWDNEPFMVKVT